MSARVIDGKAYAGALRARIAAAVGDLGGRLMPGLAVVLVGNDPASEVYVRNKLRETAAVGMRSIEHRLPAEVSEVDLLALVSRLNDDPAVHGILVQMPLPAHIDTARVLARIDPEKDVDGLNPLNAGRLAQGQGSLVPCTPQGALHLIKDVQPHLAGLSALVIGRSVLVGRPMAQLLLGENCTVTIAHSHTRDLPALCRQSDVVVAALGRPHFVKGDWIKPGAIVIDVGINRIADEAGKGRLVGDVDYEAARNRAGAITPVPGGVGPMTIACLLRNTLIAACALAGLSPPAL